jgi:hypothetical protein
MTEESMIERVAKALSDASDYGSASDAFERGDNKGGYEELARAAIEAMGAPSKAMIDAGATAADDAMDSDYDSGPHGEDHNVNTYLRSDAPSLIWKAMLDAADD